MLVALVNKAFPEWTHIEMRFERCIGTAAVWVEVFFWSGALKNLADLRWALRSEVSALA